MINFHNLLIYCQTHFSLHGRKRVCWFQFSKCFQFFFFSVIKFNFQTYAYFIFQMRISSSKHFPSQKKKCVCCYPKHLLSEEFIVIFLEQTAIELLHLLFGLPSYWLFFVVQFTGTFSKVLVWTALCVSIITYYFLHITRIEFLMAEQNWWWRRRHKVLLNKCSLPGFSFIFVALYYFYYFLHMEIAEHNNAFLFAILFHQ